MTDVAQILGIQRPSSSASATGGSATTSELDKLKPTGTPIIVKSSSAKPKVKKPSGMQREVLTLLENSHRGNHALYPGLNKLSLQQKWKQSKNKPAVKWKRKSFMNPARKELAGENQDAEEPTGLVLKHWVKAHVDPPEYIFARFNVKSSVFQFSDDEYDKVLVAHRDPLGEQWTKADTKILFEICEKLNLRWIVIADRFNRRIEQEATFQAAQPPQNSPKSTARVRTVEELKYRYYEVCRLVVEYRESNSTLDGIKVEPPCSNSTSTSTSTSSNNPSTSTTPTAAPSDEHHAVDKYRFNLEYERQRKQQLELAFLRTNEEENELKSLQEELRHVESQLKKVSVQVDSKKKKELADVPYEIHRVMPRGVFLRSSTLALPSGKHTLSTKVLKKMELMLEELGVPARPMPTKASCEMFDRLRQQIVGLLSLRKHLHAKDIEIQALKERYQTLTGQQYKPITTPIVKRERRAASASSLSTPLNANAATPSGPIAGKSLKHSEKALRTSNKRRASGISNSSATAATAASSLSSSSSLPAKRNKKNAVMP